MPVHPVRLAYQQRHVTGSACRYICRAKAGVKRHYRKGHGRETYRPGECQGEEVEGFRSIRMTEIDAAIAI